jgi:hypothetical protein
MEVFLKYSTKLFTQAVTDEQAFIWKVLLARLYTDNFDNFYYDKYTCSKASML